MNDLETIKELHESMTFFAYRSYNLDLIEDSFTKRYGRPPQAFLTRSPYGISGKHSNRKKLVLSSKYCGANCVQVPLILNKIQLEDVIMQLGEVKDLVYVERRKLDNAIKLQQLKAENQRRKELNTKYCKYCGNKFMSNDSYCGSSRCRMLHKEHLANLREQRRKEAAQHGKMTINQKMPEFDLDDPKNTSLQGYVYCIRAENGFCKIGRSSDVVNRFNEIRTMSPISVSLDHYVFSDNYVVAESYAHDELDVYRHHGEWFDLPEDVYGWFLELDNYDLDAA